MTLWQREPTLTEMLSDPLIALLMRADGVDPDALRPELCAVARDLKTTRGAALAAECVCG
jgi:hypothetical protein